MKRVFTAMLALVTLSPQFAVAQDFVLDGINLNQNFELTGQTTHTVFEDHVTPLTCYRSEVTDHRQECSTQYQEQCTDTPLQVCTDEDRQECTPITRQECSDVPRQECSPVEHRECTPITRQECSDENHQTCHPVTHNECHDERVCHQVQEETCRTDAQGNRTCVPYTTQRCENQNVCHDVTTQDCSTTSERVCRNVADEVCRTTSENVCRTVNDHQCRSVSDQVCRSYTENVCHTENDHQCQQVPHQECNSVPVYSQVPYDCSTTEHVAVGEEVDFNITANVAVNFRQPAQGLTVNERLSLTLAGEEVQLVCNTPSNAVLLIATRTSTSNITGPSQKTVNASFDVTSVETSQVLSPISKPIQELVGNAKKVEFKIGKVLAPRFLSIGLKLVRAPGTPGSVTAFNAEVPQRAYTLRDARVQYVDDAGQAVDEVRTQVTIDLSQLQLSEALRQGNYSFTVGSNLNAQLIQALLNPSSLPQAQGVQAQARYDINP